MIVREASVASTRAVLLSGWVCLVTGVLGLASAILLIGAQPSVGDDYFRYPFTPGGFAVAQTWFFVQHLGLLAGLYALWRSGVVGRGPLGRLGSWGAMVGMGLLAVTELVAITGSDSIRPSARTDMIDSLYGIASVTIGVALIVVGIAVIRTRRWQGWRRAIPLILGIYVFVPLTPALLGSWVLARLAIGGWMLGFALLGWALVKTAQATAPTPPAS